MQVFFNMCTEYHHVCKAVHSTYYEIVSQNMDDPTIIDRDDKRLQMLKDEEDRFTASTKKQQITAAWQTSSEAARSMDQTETERSRVGTTSLKSKYTKSANDAAQLAASKTICNDEDGNAFQFWQDEVARVNVADEEEISRVKAWETLQLAVVKAAKENVLRLLAPDVGGVDYEDELARIQWYTKAFRSRSKVSDPHPYPHPYPHPHPPSNSTNILYVGAGGEGEVHETAVLGREARPGGVQGVEKCTGQVEGCK
tara:strand:- start:42 stop:806 length:765 start_codon:yes stop_codon:yes gene_type:complete